MNSITHDESEQIEPSIPLQTGNQSSNERHSNDADSSNDLSLGKSIQSVNIEDVGGASMQIQGNVDAGRDFIGRDQIINITTLAPSKINPFESWEPETVLIPQGQFVMGSNNQNPEEAPQHVLNLPEFSIGKYPVMNWQYAEYIWAEKLLAPSSLLWDGNSPPEGENEYPVAGVTWYEALDYCRWLFDVTGRTYALPSEAQWEKAARGSDDRLYPWGNDWEPTRCNAFEEHLLSVKKFDAQSVFGCYDMVGNAREWTTSIWGESVPQPDSKYKYPWPDDNKKWNERNKLNEPLTIRRIFRGGRHTRPADYRCTFRGGSLPDSRGPKNNRNGFRVILIQG